MKDINVKTGFSKKRNEFKAVEEAYSQIAQEKISLVYFCLDKGYNQKKINEAWQKKLPNVPFIGIGGGGWIPMMGNLTGLITPKGIQDKGLVAMSIASDKIQAVVKSIHNLSENCKEESERVLEETAKDFNLDLENLDPEKCFGLFFYNLFSEKGILIEEILDNFYKIAPNLLFVGEGTIKFSFKKFRLIGGAIHTPEGCFEKQDAAIVLIKSEIPFVLEMSSNYQLAGDKVFKCGKVRDFVVEELNGRPAAEAYSQALGVSVRKLGSPMMPNLAIMTKNPFGAIIRDKAFTRVVVAPSKDKKGLIFYQKMTEGQEIYLLERTDILEDTRKMLGRTKDILSEISAIIYFPCLLRIKTLRDFKIPFSEMYDVLNIAPMVGMHMGGEIYGGILSSITITCLAFGSPNK